MAQQKKAQERAAQMMREASALRKAREVGRRSKRFFVDDVDGFERIMGICGQSCQTMAGVDDFFFGGSGFFTTKGVGF